LRSFCAWLLVFVTAAAPSIAIAKPGPSKGNPDAEVLEVTKNAEALLDKLEYERARELLESSARSLAAYKKAKAPARARLWALLGRARAELGDAVGADEAFLKAVAFDRRVKLAPGTSPKILEALERARANAPAQAEVEAEEQQPDPSPPPSKQVEPRPKPRAKPDAGVATATNFDASTPDAGAKFVASPDAGAKFVANDAGVSNIDAGTATQPADTEPKTEPKIEQPKPPPQPKALGPTIRHRVLGDVLPGRTITVVIEPQNLPKNTKLELYIRRATTSPFKQELLTKTGTTATRKLTMDRPRYELYVRAVKGKKTVAQLGSENDPIVISTLPPPPSLVDAWSTKEDRPRFVETSTTGTSTLATNSTKTSSTALVPPTKVTKPPDDDDTLLYVGVGIGAAVVAAAVVITVVLLTRKSDCDSEEGFGCVEIEVQPLFSF
jgi:hypothetical protein